MLAAEIKESRETLEVIAKPNVFSSVVAIIAIVLYLGSQWVDRQDRRDGHAEMVTVLKEVAGRLERIEKLANNNAAALEAAARASR